MKSCLCNIHTWGEQDWPRRSLWPGSIIIIRKGWGSQTFWPTNTWKSNYAT